MTKSIVLLQKLCKNCPHPEKLHCMKSIKPVFIGAVSCGQHFAATCELCPGPYAAKWCNGDCEWQNWNNYCNSKLNPIPTRLG